MADAPTFSKDPAVPSKCADVVMGASKSAEDGQDAPANSSSSGPGTTAADVAPTDIPSEMADTQADSPTPSDVGDVGTQTYTDDEEVDLSVWYCDHPIFYNLTRIVGRRRGSWSRRVVPWTLLVQVNIFQYYVPLKMFYMLI